MMYLAAFLVSALYIALKALQQRQVMNAEYLKMPAVSLAMGFCEVFIVANVARTADGFWPLVGLAICIGSGSGLGSILGTYFHVTSHRRKSA
jgi:hypothetical protein